MTVASAHCWFNGQIRPREESAPSIASISFHLGTGVFDGLIAYWNNDHYYLHRIEEHLVRFLAGSARMGLQVSWSVEELVRAIENLLQHEPQGTQYVRPIAFRGGPELWITGSEGRPVDVSIFTVRMKRDDDSVIRCQLSAVERLSGRSVPAQTKVSGAYVNSHYARRMAEQAGFQDGLMFDRQGCLAEASAANVFLIRDGALYTPLLNEDVFPGITRGVVIELAARRGIEVLERNIRKQDIPQFEGAFLCSTLMELRAISQLDEVALGTAQLPLYRGVLEEFRRLTHEAPSHSLGHEGRLGPHRA
jgi:branched-chain amino acid aminotransferase